MSFQKSAARLLFSGFPLLAAMGLFCPAPTLAADEAEAKLKPMQPVMRGIHTMLLTYAVDNGGNFPDEPSDANRNLRKLFMKRLMDDETIFGIPGDGWCLEGKPDGDIGAHPLYHKALEPGELSVAYVAGLTTESASDLPLIICGAGPATGWIVGLEKTRPPVPFVDPVIVTFLNGSTQVMKPGRDGKLWKMKDGKLMDIFSREYGTDPAKIRLPAMPEKAEPGAGKKEEPEAQKPAAEVKPESGKARPE